MAIKIKYLILGAGPTGVALATRLQQLHETSFLILEKENEAGGLCRSQEVDGSPLDIGGGHFLDVRRENVLNYIFEFMAKDEWNLFDRISKIKTEAFEIDYPYEANIWQLPIENQVEHLTSIMNAGSNRNIPMPDRFSEWITWKLGALIAGNYMLPYNTKIFSDVSLDELGTYWLYKLPNVSFEDTLKSCLYRKSHGNLPAHAQFYYPKKYGYGEVFKRMACSLGNKLILNYKIESLDIGNLMVNHEIRADIIISTIPWPEFIQFGALSETVKGLIHQLKYSSIDVTYRPEDASTNSHWTYIPDENVPYHRILFRKNYLNGAKGYWEETNSLRSKPNEPNNFHNQYAYPLNTTRKPGIIKSILSWAKENSIIGLGRWGEWEHMNSDAAIEKGITLAENLTSK